MGPVIKGLLLYSFYHSNFISADLIKIQRKSKRHVKVAVILLVKQESTSDESEGHVKQWNFGSELGHNVTL